MGMYFEYVILFILNALKQLPVNLKFQVHHIPEWRKCEIQK